MDILQKTQSSPEMKQYARKKDAADKCEQRKECSDEHTPLNSNQNKNRKYESRKYRSVLERVGVVSSRNQKARPTSVAALVGVVGVANVTVVSVFS